MEISVWVNLVKQTANMSVSLLCFERLQWLNSLIYLKQNRRTNWCAFQSIFGPSDRVSCEYIEACPEYALSSMFVLIDLCKNCNTLKFSVNNSITACSGQELPTQTGNHLTDITFYIYLFSWCFYPKRLTIDIYVS